MQLSSPHSVDLHVGQEVRKQRILVGLSQQEVAEAIGVSFQQVQKYEKGSNRLSASKLYEISTVLNVPVAHFFFGLPHQDQHRIEEMQFHYGEASRESAKIFNMLQSIADPTIRKKLIDLMHSLAESR